MRGGKAPRLKISATVQTYSDDISARKTLMGILRTAIHKRNILFLVIETYIRSHWYFYILKKKKFATFKFHMWIWELSLYIAY